MVSDGHTHWIIVQVAGNTLVSVAPVASLASVYVAPTVRDAVRVLSRGDMAAVPLVGDNLQTLRAVLGRHGVVV